MAYGVKLKVWSDYACFTRPEMKVERVSYDVITPSAARGILEAIYWKPEIRWVIDRIYVYEKPRFTNIRRNEVSERISAGNINQAMKGTKKDLFICVDEVDDRGSLKYRQQRAAMILKGVEYIIEAHFDLLDDQKNEGPEKHRRQFTDRVKMGQCFHRPYMGCKEFPAHFSLVEGEIPPSPLSGERDLGWMLYDLSYLPVEGKEAKDRDIFWAKVNSEYAQVKAEAKFFRAIMKDGVIDVKELVEKQGVFK
ncbi:type I-C CRISPR-associated protein Cas5 [bacterium]|nr:type I-C CRISPR-associated protein Cas5 [bacterium]